MLLAEFLLKVQNEYNGHKQTTIEGIPLSQGLEICKTLEEYDDKHLYVCEVYTDGSYTIWQKSDVLSDEHEDKMILGVTV